MKKIFTCMAPLLLAALSLLCFLLYGKLRARTAEGAKGIHMDQVKKGAADANVRRSNMGGRMKNPFRYE